MTRGREAAHRGRVLVVEDEGYVRESLTEILRERGYDVVGAGTVAEGMALPGAQRRWTSC